MVNFSKWRNLKYWQKGGIIGTIIAIILSLLSLTCLFIIDSYYGIACLLIPAGLQILSIADYLSYFSGNMVYFFGLENTYIYGFSVIEWLLIVYYYLISIIVYSLIGMLIGLTYEQLKLKNKEYKEKYRKNI